jgi:hypothetical protein
VTDNPARSALTCRYYIAVVRKMKCNIHGSGWRQSVLPANRLLA